jgi:hypothetical protein
MRSAIILDIQAENLNSERSRRRSSVEAEEDWEGSPWCPPGALFLNSGSGLLQAAGRYCVARFRSSLCPFGVKSAGSTSSRRSRHVRFASRSDRIGVATNGRDVPIATHAMQQDIAIRSPRQRRAAFAGQSTPTYWPVHKLICLCCCSPNNRSPFYCPHGKQSPPALRQ